MYVKNMLHFLCFNLYLETYDFLPFLDRLFTFNKSFLVPLDHFY